MKKKDPHLVARQLERAERELSLKPRLRAAQRLAAAVPVILTSCRPTPKGLRLLEARIRQNEKVRTLYRALVTDYPGVTLKTLAALWPRGGKRRKAEATLLKVYNQILAHRGGKRKHAAALKVDVHTFSSRKKELQARGFLPGPAARRP